SWQKWNKFTGRCKSLSSKTMCYKRRNRTWRRMFRNSSRSMQKRHGKTSRFHITLRCFSQAAADNLLWLCSQKRKLEEMYESLRGEYESLKQGTPGLARPSTARVRAQAAYVPTPDSMELGRKRQNQ
ncbi:unnamed protein product, partial [Closterium sp. Naga37s-1]